VAGGWWGRAPARSGVARPIKVEMASPIAFVVMSLIGRATPDRAGARPYRH
jgi:hypothetical protein